jgi:hypothetical protein
VNPVPTKPAAAKSTAVKTTPKVVAAKPEVTKSHPPVPPAPRRVPASVKSRPERALDHDDWGVAPPIPEISRKPAPTIELMKASRAPKLEELLKQN